MKFKITEIKVDSVKAEYEDGSWALVPIQKGQTKEIIELNIVSYNNNNSFDKVQDIPVTISTDWEDKSVGDVSVTYAAAREIHYPLLGDQLDALHWAREGDDTNLKAIDEVIKTVKTKIPKGSSYKNSEVNALLD